MTDRSKYMDPQQRSAMGVGARRLHHVCRALTGVARPGKTARDRDRKTQRGG